MTVRRRSPLPVIALAVIAACAKPDATPAAKSVDSGAASAAAPAIPVVTIEASDYAYKAPDTVSAGMTTLHMLNTGPEMHHIQLFRFTGGKTYADFAEAVRTMKPTDALPAWVEVLAGPNSPVPGATADVMLELAAGQYALACVIPSPDHVPHIAKGMMKSLIVVPATGPTAAAPASDIHVTMTDYAWDITPAISAGKHVIRLENLAEQDHEMFIVRLEKGKTPMEVAQWSEAPSGPPPATALGGTSGMRKGSVIYVPVDLTPGEYALLCFIPDAKDGKPHYVHGMVKAFTVS